MYADPKTDIIILTSNCNEWFYWLVYPFLVNALGDDKHCPRAESFQTRILL
jgi:hypothetical protein